MEDKLRSLINKEIREFLSNIEENGLVGPDGIIKGAPTPDQVKKMRKKLDQEESVEQDFETDAEKDFYHHHLTSMGAPMGTPAEHDTYDFDDGGDEEPGVQDEKDKVERGYEKVEEVKVDSSRYKRSHGKDPKGSGTWLFSFDEKGDDVFDVGGYMTYTSAKKLALKKAKEAGKGYVYVMESELFGQLAGDSAETLKDELKQYVKGIIKQPNDNVTYLHLKSASAGKKVVTLLKKIYGIESRIDNWKFSPSKAVVFDNDQMLESVNEDTIDRYYVLYKSKAGRKLTKYFDKRDKAEKFYSNSDSLDLGYIGGGKSRSLIGADGKIKKESVNEMQVVNKKTGKDVTKHLLDLMMKKITQKEFEKLTGLKKDKLKVNEELRPDELEHLAKQVAIHKQWDNWEPTDKEVLDAIKKDKVFGKDLLKYSTTKQKKQAIKIIQAYLSESVNEAIKYKKGKTYQSGGNWTVYMSDDSASFDIKVNNSAGWSTDPHDRRGETLRLQDAGKTVATLRFKEGNINALAKKMHDLTSETTWGEKEGLKPKDYADIIRVWIDMGMAMNESVNEAEGDISTFEYIAANVNTQDKFIKALGMLDDRIEAFGNRRVLGDKKKKAILVKIPRGMEQKVSALAKKMRLKPSLDNESVNEVSMDYKFNKSISKIKRPSGYTRAQQAISKFIKSKADNYEILDPTKTGREFEIGIHKTDIDQKTMIKKLSSLLNKLGHKKAKVVAGDIFSDDGKYYEVSVDLNEVNESMELVHVYADKKHKDLYGTGELVPGKSKKKGKHTYHLIRFDANNEKYVPDVLVKVVESVNEGKYYITRNLGRGQGMSLVKDLDKPKEFKSYKDAKKEADRLERGSRNMTAYFVSDKDMKIVSESVNEARMTFKAYLKKLDSRIVDAAKAVSGMNGDDSKIEPTRGDILQNFQLFRNYIKDLIRRHGDNKTKLKFLSEQFAIVDEALLIKEEKAPAPVVVALADEFMKKKEYEKLIAGLIRKHSKKAKKGYEGWSNAAEFGTFAQAQYLVQTTLTDRGTSDVTPGGEYHTRDHVPMNFRLHTIWRSDGDSEASFNVSYDYAGGMSVFDSIKLVRGDQRGNANKIKKYVTQIFKQLESLKESVNETDYQSKLSRGHKPDWYQLGTSEFKPFNESEEKMPCPAATKDLKLNTKNRDASIKADHIKYGPLNVDEPGDYWKDIAEYWDTTEEAAKKSKCSNCVAFDISPRMEECMPGATSDEDGKLGYCWMHHFKCHSARSCRTWAKGGPITKNEVSYDWQERNKQVTENKLTAFKTAAKDGNLKHHILQYKKLAKAGDTTKRYEKYQELIKLGKGFGFKKADWDTLGRVSGAGSKAFSAKYVS